MMARKMKKNGTRVSARSKGLGRARAARGAVAKEQVGAGKDRVLTARETKKLRELVDLHGENGAMEKLNLSRGTLPRLLARLPARRATLSAVRQQLGASQA